MIFICFLSRNFFNLSSSLEALVHFIYFLHITCFKVDFYWIIFLYLPRKWRVTWVACRAERNNSEEYPQFSSAVCCACLGVFSLTEWGVLVVSWSPALPAPDPGHSTRCSGSESTLSTLIIIVSLSLLNKSHDHHHCISVNTFVQHNHTSLIIIIISF